MRGEVENPMILDSIWKDREQLPKVYGECAGCEEDIVSGNDYYEFKANGETIMVHQHMACCQQFIGEIAICRTAGEDDD